MKKLLIITRWYLPAVKSGGTVQSTSALVNGLKSEFDISIITSNKDLGAKEPYKNVLFNQWINLFGIKIVYLSKLDIKSMDKYIKECSPEVIYLNSFFDITTQLFIYLKLKGKIKSKIILAPRGELGKGALSIKSGKKKIYLFLYKLFNLSKGITFHATSKEDAEDIKLFFPKNKIEIIQNLKAETTETYLLPEKESGKIKMVFISRIAPVKNLLYGLEVLNNNSFEGMIEFDIYGPEEDKDYWMQCKEVMAKLPSNIFVNYKGFVDPKDIGLTLSQYHLFFLPTKGENFGHAIVEAMRVGLLPLISNKTPWTNLETHQAGFSLSLEERETFALAIQKVLLFNNEKFMEYSNNVKRYIGEKINTQKTLEEYKVLFEQ